MEDKLITLKNYETMVEALFDQEILAENGIESTINNEDAVDLMPMFGELNDGLRIMVLDVDYEKAINALTEYQQTIAEINQDEEE